MTPDQSESISPQIADSQNLGTDQLANYNAEKIESYRTSFKRWCLS